MSSLGKRIVAVLSVVVLAVLTAAIGGCSVSSEAPPQRWEEVTSGHISGDKPASEYLGTFYLAGVRLSWLLSGPRNPQVSLGLKVVAAGNGDTTVVSKPRQDTVPGQDDFALVLGRLQPGEYHVYLLQRFPKGQGPGYDVDFTLYSVALD